MWKEESKDIVLVELNEVGTNILEFINEPIIKQKYKFYLLGEAPYSLQKELNSMKIEWELFQVPEDVMEREEFYNSIDFGIYIGKESALKTKARFMLIPESLENDNLKYSNLENYYLVYGFEDIKNILSFFAANEME